LTAATARPNVQLLVVDCLRADHAYREGLARIPAVDRLRAEGFGFSQAIAALLTGCYPLENGVRSHAGHRLAGGLRTLPELLRQGGYRTCAEVTGPPAD